MVLHDPLDWALEAQVVVDVLRGGALNNVSIQIHLLQITHLSLIVCWWRAADIIEPRRPGYAVDTSVGFSLAARVLCFAKGSQSSDDKRWSSRSGFGVVARSADILL